MKNPFRFIKGFRRRCSDIPEEAVISTVIPSLSARPVDIRNTYTFTENRIDRLGKERKRLKKQQVDYLHKDLRSAESEAERRRELISGDKQYASQLFNISTIIANTKGEIEEAKKRERLIIKEIEYYDSLLGKENGALL